MKKVILLCAAVLVFGLTGCADKNVPTAEVTAEPTVSAAPSDTVEVTATPEVTATEEATPEPTPEPTPVSRDWNNTADISWIDPEKPMVALSFDDGPVSPVSESSSAMRIQKALSDNGMHATFFYWGNSLTAATKKELESAYELGFELGNHTKTHPDLTKLTAEEIETEVSTIDKTLHAITGNDQFLVRPPYLACNQLVKDTINVPLISCGLDTQDWNGKTTEEIIDVVVKAAENGTLDGKIVLMHETYTTTAEAVEYLVPYLKEQGYQVVTISEMFKVRGKEMKAGKMYTECKK